MSKTSKRDIILIISLLVIFTLMLVLFSIGKTKGNTVEVTVKGEVFGKYFLNEDKTIEVYDLCVIEIKNSTVFVKSSTCKNQNCVHHQPINADGDTIICLPNAVIIHIGNTDTDFVI